MFLRVSATDAAEMMFSNKVNFAGAVWQPYDDGQVHFWTLVPGDGLRTVYVAFRDAAGNPIGDDGIYNSAVTVDSVPPDAPVFTIQEGSHTNLLPVNLDLSNPTAGDTVLLLQVSRR